MSTKKQHNKIYGKPGTSKRHWAATPYNPLRGVGGRPSVSVPAVPREFWVSLDPDKQKDKPQ